MTGALERKVTGSSGRTARGDKEGVSPSVSVTAGAHGAPPGMGEGLTESSWAGQRQVTL